MSEQTTHRRRRTSWIVIVAATAATAVLAVTGVGWAVMAGGDDGGGSSQDSPGEVVLAGYRAIGADDIDGYLGLLCRARHDVSTREELEAQFDWKGGLVQLAEWRILDERIDSDTAEVDVDAPNIPRVDPHTVHLVREGGEWKLC